MNQNLSKLQPYPFEKLTKLLSGIDAPQHIPPISLSIGEPKHPPAEFLIQSYQEQTAGLSAYPSIKGTLELRNTIGRWLQNRFQLPKGSVNPETQVLPVNGTREALFAFVQVAIDTTKANPPRVVMPNPFYQIYEGATFLAGAEPYFLNCTADQHYLPDFDAVSEQIWHDCQILFICNPGNPTGTVMTIEQLQKLINLAEQYDFVIASDECYSEIYFDEATPPAGLLQAAAAMGNTSYKRCLVFHSLSKRSNLPGLRSGFVAGDEQLIASFYRYRTYHGCAMPLQAQATSILAWQDEKHVIQSRQMYREKFLQFKHVLGDSLDFSIPEASFYLWAKTSISDEKFTQQLYRQQNIICLPGRYLGRTEKGINPGEDHVRLALVSSMDQCEEAALRIKALLNSL